MNFIISKNTETINSLRAKLYQNLTAPLDAMWELLYVASSQHYLIENKNSTLGYCCINEESALVQIYLEEEYASQMSHIIQELIKTELIKSVSLSSNETVGFNACLFHSKSIKPNTFCFEHLNTEIEVNSALNVELVSTGSIPAIKAFYKAQIGMDDTFGYTENLVSRKELFMVKQSDVIIATSECRLSDSQPDIADLGIIVNKSFQGKGIATQVMQVQVNRVLRLGRKPICSTTVDNIASRKTIDKSGFYCSNIIFDMSFKS